MAAVAPFAHPYFDCALFKHCSVCRCDETRVQCPLCRRPACPTARAIRNDNSGGPGEKRCTGCGTAVAVTPAGAKFEDERHATECATCRDNVPLVACEQCGWTTCGHCRTLEEPQKEHVARCLALAHASIAREVVSLMGSSDPAKVWALMLAEITRRLAVNYPGPASKDPVEARLEWDALRANGFGPPTPDIMKTLESTLPGLETRGSSMASIVLSALIYQHDLDDVELEMQQLMTFWALNAFKRNLHVVLQGLPAAGSSEDLPAARCYLLSPQTLVDRYRTEVATGVSPLTLWKRDFDLAVVPGANVAYLITLIDTGRDENAFLLGVGNPAADPEARTWSPEVRKQRQAKWNKLTERCAILATHQLLVRVVATASADVCAIVVQSHGRTYSVADWWDGKVPAPEACREWSQGGAFGRESLFRLGALLDELADPKGPDGAARAVAYSRLTGVVLGRPLDPMRIVTLRVNFHA